MRTQRLATRCSSGRARSSRDTSNIREIPKQLAQEQPETLEGVMGKILDLVKEHPEWYRQERAERMNNIFHALLRL